MRKLSFLSCILLLLVGLSTSSCKDKKDTPEEKQKAEAEVSVEETGKTSQEKTTKAANEQIVCNKFNLVTKTTDTTLELSIDTDLPDNTVVMVSVSRSYQEKGSPESYSLDYFSEKSTIGKWKTNHRISISSEKWKNALKTKQEKLSRIGADFDVASISNKITAHMVVPINQPNPKFGKRNSNLTGKAVTMVSKGGKTITGEVVGPMYVVEDKTEINHPLDSSLAEMGSSPSLDPLGLENGQDYIVSKQTPLMPSLNPADHMAAIQQMKQIPKGGAFKVLETTKKENSLWYKVTAFDQNKKQIGTGWINSTALLGQEIKADK